jgi:hypothetical protein
MIMKCEGPREINFSFDEIARKKVEIAPTMKQNI